MVSRNIASKGFKTVKLQTPVHTQSTKYAFRNVFFFPLYDVVLLGNQMQIDIFGKDGEGGHYHIHLNKTA